MAFVPSLKDKSYTTPFWIPIQRWSVDQMPPFGKTSISLSVIPMGVTMLAMQINNPTAPITPKLQG